jgi:uncharacterized protein HemX
MPPILWLFVAMGYSLVLVCWESIRQDRITNELDQRLKKIEDEKKDALLMLIEQLQQRIQVLENEIHKG